MQVWVTARLDGDDVSATVHAAAEYGDTGRTASAVVDVDGDDLAQVEAALGKILAAHRKRAEGRATLAAAEALTVAARRDEEEV